MDNQSKIRVVVTGKTMAQNISELLTKHEISHYIITKSRGVSLKFNFLEFLGFVETKKNILLFKCNEEMHKTIIKYILKYMNYKNNGIMFTIEGENKMELDNQMFVGIINAGKGESLADLIRKKCHAGATIIDARGSGADVEKFLGIEIDSNKEIVFSVMPNEQISKLKNEIKKAFDGANTDVVSFALPISHFNKLHQ